MYFCRKYSFTLLFTTVIFYQVEKEEIEYVPAPPPKTNPWKKPVVEPVPEKSSKPSSEATAKTVEITQEKLKPEKSKVVAESKQHHATVSKSNPWKKLEKSSKAVDESVGAEEEDGAERKGERGGNSSTWPTLALKPSKTGKKKEGDRSGHASSVEEGKENQVFPLFLPFMNGI